MNAVRFDHTHDPSSQLRLSTIMSTPPVHISRLSKIIQKLRADPKPVLTPSLKSLRLIYAARNDHFGARCVRRPFNDLAASGPYAHF